MKTKRLALKVFSAACVVLGTTAALSQDFPNKPIRIVTLAAGGGADLSSRLIAPGLAAGLGQPAVVDPRGGGVMPGEIVSKAPPDGYTVLITGSTLWVASLLQKTPYDTLRDFSAVTMISKEVNVLLVQPSLQVKTIKELIALAKAKPGQLNYSSGATGTPPHLGGELFKYLAGVNIVRVPYNGAAPGLNALAAGETQMMIVGAGSAAAQIKAGRLSGLGVTSAQPSSLFPGLPPIAATLPGYELSSVLVMLAPIKTPAAIVQKLNQETVRAINLPDIKQVFTSNVQEIVGSSPADTDAVIKADITTIGKLVKDVGIRAD